jgi:Leucine-rich repeat (LRR) protein
MDRAWSQKSILVSFVVIGAKHSCLCYSSDAFETSSFSSCLELSLILPDQNNMRGSIPKELQSLEFLEELDLDSNSLVGHFPSWVGGMKHLQKLDIDRNVLSGSIPDELYGSTSLSFVDMNHNILSGTISTKIGQMTQLVFWQFDWNQLIGTVPSEVASLPNLQYFSLFGNGFSDNVGMPRQVCEMGIQLYATCGMCGQDCCTVCLPEDVVLP